MSDSGGARFSVLERRLLMSKSVLSATLSRLEKDGWLARNPGHGHPLRPEYMLTAQGRGVAAWCATMSAERSALGLGPDLLGRWAVPIIAGIGTGWKRFTILQRELVPISPRALSLELSGLCEAALVLRKAPGPVYGLTGRGAKFAEATELI